jgi:hypothetical protein
MSYSHYVLHFGNGMLASVCTDIEDRHPCICLLNDEGILCSSSFISQSRTVRIGQFILKNPSVSVLCLFVN